MKKQMKARDRSEKLGDLPNDRLVVLAAYLADAARSPADTEDIAIKAAQLSPGRFSWRKYPEQINIETVRKRLWDAASERKGQLLTGSEREGWLLTEAGLQFCKEKHELLGSVGEAALRLTQKEQSWATREKARMQSETAFLKWKEGRANKIVPVEAERFFRIDDYVVGDLRHSRISRARDIFAVDEIMAEAIEDIAKMVRKRE